MGDELEELRCGRTEALRWVLRANRVGLGRHARTRVGDKIVAGGSGHPVRHRERHRTERIGWLRAAVLGANDGIVSTASLVVGVAAARASRSDIMVAGVAGLVAGALSMAAGEYVSVSSQADTEHADLTRERTELATDPAGEEDELAGIYVERGVEPSMARIVAQQLM